MRNNIMDKKTISIIGADTDAIIEHMGI